MAAQRQARSRHDVRCVAQIACRDGLKKPDRRWDLGLEVLQVDLGHGLRGVGIHEYSFGLAGESNQGSDAVIHQTTSQLFC